MSSRWGISLWLFAWGFSSFSCAGDIDGLSLRNAKIIAEYQRIVKTADEKYGGDWFFQSEYPMLVSQKEAPPANRLGTLSIAFVTNTVPFIVDVKLVYTIVDGLSPEVHESAQCLILNVGSLVTSGTRMIGTVHILYCYEISGNEVLPDFLNGRDWRNDEQTKNLREQLKQLWSHFLLSPPTNSLFGADPMLPDSGGGQKNKNEK